MCETALSSPHQNNFLQSCGLSARLTCRSVHKTRASTRFAAKGSAAEVAAMPQRMVAIHKPQQKIESRMPLLEVTALDAWYGRAQILHGVSLSIEPGEAVVLLGRNGAGKSTTLKTIIGLETRSEGGIRLAGEDIRGWPTHRIARAGVGFVPEDRRLFGGLTVTENLAAGRLPARNGHAWDVDELLQLFPQLGGLLHRPAARMSGGEQQMLTIARTLMGNPRCILLDEPSEGLAPLILEKIAAAILELKRRGTGLLVSEQNMNFARRFADRAYILENGTVRFSGRMTEFDADPELSRQYLSV